jgi:tetratricopeptide (TPR) repeat protein
MRVSRIDEPPSGLYTTKQVTRLFDLPVGRLRYWSQTGFVTPSVRHEGRTYYDFRDLIAIKVAKALLDSGLPLRRVRHSLAALKRDLPQDEPLLSRVRIRCEGDKVVVDEDTHSYEASTGQLMLDFSVDALRQQTAKVLSLPWVDDEEVCRDEDSDVSHPYRWFLRACELEDEWGGAPADRAGFEAAKQAYERALELDPQLAGAWTNLGAMWAQIGELEQAREHFERALGCDPQQPEAHHNLAELALRMGDAEAAISGFRRLLQLDPDWAEAHYGLARALLSVGGRVQALAHLQRFSKLIDAIPRELWDEELDERRLRVRSLIEQLVAERSSG